MDKKGFTLIELLLVIVIVVILTLILLLLISNRSISRARDAERQAEVSEIRRSLEEHNVDKGKYPEVPDWTKIEEDNDNNGSLSQSLRPYLRTIPRDPRYPQTTEDKVFSYQYKSGPNGACYKIHVEMEAQDAYETSTPGCEGLVYNAGGGSNGQTPGPSGYVLQFNGQNAYLSVPDSNSLDITDEISIEAWIKANIVSPTPNWRTVVVKRCSYAECYGFNVTFDQSKINFFMQGQTGGVWWAETDLPRGNWIHVVGTWNRASSNNIDLYFNGQLLGGGTVRNNPIRTSLLPLLIGGVSGVDYTSSYSPYYFDGQLDQIRIYAKRLPPNIVLAHYQGDFSQDNNGCGGASCDLRAAWNFDEGQGTIAHDSSGNNNHATLINNPIWIKVM